MDAPEPTPEERRALAAAEGEAPAAEEPPAAIAVVDPAATKAAVERGRDDERSRWGLVLIAAVVLAALVAAWKGPAILAFFAGPR
jgi:hypothetical protein